MGERRKHNSYWDSEEDTKHHHSNYDGGRYHESSAPKSMDNSGWRPWESNEGKSTLPSDGFIKNRQDAPEVKEIGGANRYYKKTSPGFDGMERRNYNNNFEDDRSHSRRYPVRGRSQSRSRSRSRGRPSGRSRSRSLSRGRGRERGIVWSRSRSRSEDTARGPTRSRSPIGDYRRQSWNDRTRGLDKSPLPCRDFAAGSCRRGSQCIFLHPNTVNRMDGERLDRGYHGKDENFVPQSRNAFPCKDFTRGKCRWGDTCRFSHDVADSGNRNESFDREIERESNQSVKPLCKFFAAGKCDRGNCRFSHDVVPKVNNDLEEERVMEVIDQYGSRDKNNWSTWEDATFVTNANSTDYSTSIRSDARSVRGFENEGKFWGEWKDDSLNRERRSSPPRGGGSNYDRDLATTQSMDKDNMANALHGSQSQNQDRIPYLQEENTLHTHPILLSGQNVNQDGERRFLGHSISNEISIGQNILGPTPPIEFIADLNLPETHIGTPSNLPVQIPNHQEAFKPPESKALQFFPNLLTNEHQQVAPATQNPLAQGFMNEQSQVYAGMELSNSRGVIPSFPPVNTTNVQLNPVTVSRDLFTPMEIGRDTSELEENSDMQVEQQSTVSDGMKFINSNLKQSPKPTQDDVVANTETDGVKKAISEESKDVKKNKQPGVREKVEEGGANKDDKGMRAFKNALIEFVKEILKPIWKEGKMSREVHKTVVKKVVDKVTSTIQADHVPKTQEKVEHYLSFSKPKITKLVQAYVERCQKTDS